MEHDLGEGWPQVGRRSEHRCDEIFEFCAEEATRSALGMGSPKVVNAIDAEETIVRVFKRGRSERWHTSRHCEEHDCEGE